jgi:Flp pilus assembly pilin Flp
LKVEVDTSNNYGHGGGHDPMKDLFVRLWKEAEGQDLTEYGLLLVLVALSAIATMQTLASALSNVFSNSASSLSTS